MATFKDNYKKLGKRLYKRGLRVHETRELLNVVLKVEEDNINDLILDFEAVRFPRRYYLAENIYYAAGADDSNYFMAYYGRLWKDYWNASYGYTLIRKFGFNQLEYVINLLNSQANTRRAIIKFTWVRQTKSIGGEPCAISMQFYIRNKKLYATVFLRSSDFVYGLKFDILYFKLLYDYVKSKLNYSLGNGGITLMISSLHVYNKDLEKLEKMLASPYVYHPFEYNFVSLYNDNSLALTVYRAVDTNKDNVLEISKNFGLIKEKRNNGKNN